MVSPPVQPRDFKGSFKGHIGPYKALGGQPKQTKRPLRDYEGLFGLIWPYWEDSAAFV